MEKVRNFIFLGLLVVLFAEVLVIFPLHLGQREETPKPSAPAAETVNSGDVDQKIQGLHLVESQRGSRDWELFAEQAEGQQGQGSWNLRKVRVLFYNNDKIDFTVLGDEGSIDGKTKDMRVRGQVRTTSMNGYVFETDDVFYSAGARRITSPGRVRMMGPADRDGSGMRVEGTRMVVDVETSKMTIVSDVRASKELVGGRRMGLIARSAEFSGRNKTARFAGDVVMEYDRVKLEGPEAAFLQSGTADFLSNIQFSGGVKVSDADKFATSENLNLDLVANRFVFTGKPKVYQNSDVLSGEQIIFLEGGKKVKVERVRAQLEKLEQ